MTYPQGPYGQGFPGQPGYQQQPGYPPGYPPQPLYQQGYPPQTGYPGIFPPPGPPSSPGGGTAITAAVLAIFGGLLNFVMGLIGFAKIIGMKADSPDTFAGGSYPLALGFVLLGVAGGLLLLIGAIMLLRRTMVARWLVVGGCSLAFLAAMISFGLRSAISEYRGSGSVLNLLFPILTIVLVLLPSTTAWIQARRGPVAPQYFPPYPHYPG